jgi:cytochrome c-type biogenesis protein
VVKEFRTATHADQTLRASAATTPRRVLPVVRGLWVPTLGLLGIALIGWVAWTYWALPGLRWVAFDAPFSLAALGFLAGIGAFFAPCAFALFPGYVSYYLTLSGAASVPRSLGLGLAAAAGSTLFFGLVGTVITLAGGVISSYLIASKPLIALAVVGLGIVQLADVRLPSVGIPRGLTAGRHLSPALAVFLYGFGYALASTGCTLPLYVSITVLPLTSGFSGAALLTFLAFAAAMAGLMLVTTLLVGVAQRDLIRALAGSTVWIKRGSGVVLILAGVYLGYYYVRAGM